MEKKRKLTDIVTTAGVGIVTTIGGIELVKIAVDIGDLVAPHIEKGLGISGSGAIAYGFPIAAGLGALSFIYTATKATDNYLLRQQE